MNIKKYISKRLATQFLVFAVIVGLAILFDVYHNNDDSSIIDIEESQQSNNVANGHFFIYNPVKTNNLTTSNNQIARKLFLCSQDKFLLNYHNNRAVSLLKSESNISLPPMSLAVQHILFTQHYYINPDDLPPVA